MLSTAVMMQHFRSRQPGAGIDYEISHLKVKACCSFIPGASGAARYLARQIIAIVSRRDATAGDSAIAAGKTTEIRELGSISSVNAL